MIKIAGEIMPITIYVVSFLDINSFWQKSSISGNLVAEFTELSRDRSNNELIDCFHLK